jgi:hypothetical protein
MRLVLGNVLRCMPARRSELVGFHLGLPQAPLTFQPQLHLAEFKPFFCEVASLMVLQAFRKAFCVTRIPVDASFSAPTLGKSPDEV